VGFGPHRGGLAGLSLVCIWGYTGWTLLSAMWAESPELAWTGANRTILYATLYTIPLVTLVSKRHMRLVGAVLVGGISAIGLLTLFRTLGDAPSLFLAGRLDAPIRYRNASAGLFAFAFWPLIVRSVVRGSSIVLRASTFAGAVMCVGLGFLTQSRGVLIGLIAGAVVAIGFGPERLRRAWLAILAAVMIAIASKSLIAPYDAFIAQDAVNIDARIRGAVGALALLTLGAFFVGMLLAILDNGLRGGAIRTAHRSAATALIAVALVAGVGALVKVGNPVSYAQSKWDEFTNVDAAVSGGTRLGSVGGQRYDLWRIAMREFRDHPLNGVGESNYGFDYYKQRATDRNLQEPHSLPLRILAETGLVGALLFLGWLGFAISVLAANWKGLRPGGGKRWAVALAAGAATVLGQGIADWTWLLPGLQGLSFLALGVAVALAHDAGPQVVRVSAPAAWRRALVVTAVLAAAVCVAFPFLADVYDRRARTAPTAEQQLAAARDAERLDPWGTTPHYLQAGALESLGRRGPAREELWQALALEPQNFTTMGLLGDFEVRAGRIAAARKWYGRASALNPKDTGLAALAAGKFQGR
jgi:hypothetical protein